MIRKLNKIVFVRVVLIAVLLAGPAMPAAVNMGRTIATRTSRR